MRRLAALFLLAAVASTGACSPERPAPSPAKAAAASDKPRDGGRIVRRLESDVETLNYLLQTTDYERNVLALIHDPLIELDANLEPIPGVAAKWDVSPDGLTYTLHLDPRATFSDGKPVTARDVMFTLRKVVDAQSQQFAGFFEGLDLAHSAAVDDRTVRVVFNQPLVPRWYAFNIAVLPEHVYGKGDFQKDHNETSVGSGPYTLAKREPGQRIHLERRADYWREKPHIQTVIFRVIGDHTVAWNAMKLGEIDEMRVKSDVWAREKDRPDVKARMTFEDFYWLNYNCIAWNNSDPILADARVRRALAMSFDRDSVIRNLYHGQARAISGPFLPDQWAADPSVQPIAFDLAGAARLLDEAGWRDADNDGVRERNAKKLTIEVLIPNGNAHGVEQSQVLQSAAKKIGIDMPVRTLDGATFFDHVMKGDFQAAMMAWSTDPDPDPYSLFHASQSAPAGMNVVRYRNADVDSMLEEGRRQFDQNKRREIYHRLHQKLAEDQPYLWTVQTATKWAVNRRVHGVKVAKGFGLYLWHPGPKGWWVE